MYLCNVYRGSSVYNKHQYPMVVLNISTARGMWVCTNVVYIGVVVYQHCYVGMYLM